MNSITHKYIYHGNIVWSMGLLDVFEWHNFVWYLQMSTEQTEPYKVEITPKHLLTRTCVETFRPRKRVLLPRAPRLNGKTNTECQGKRSRDGRASRTHPHPHPVRFRSTRNEHDVYARPRNVEAEIVRNSLHLHRYVTQDTPIHPAVSDMCHG